MRGLIHLCLCSNVAVFFVAMRPHLKENGSKMQGKLSHTQLCSRSNVLLSDVDDNVK